MAQPTAATEGPSLLSPKAQSFLREGAKLVGVAAVKVVSRAFAWGSLGLALGAATGLGLLLAGQLDYPSWPPFRYVAWLLCALYPIGGAAALGYAGALRGLGRTAIHLGVERGLVGYLTERLLDRMTAAVRRSRAVHGAALRGNELIENLPLDQAERFLKEAVHDYISSDDLEGEVRGLGRRALRSLKRLLVEKIELYLLSLVRAERTERGGGGVSIEKVKQLAVDRAPGVVQAGIEGMMNKYLALSLALVSLAFAAAPVALAVARARSAP